METADPVLDTVQLRDVTMNDEQLMREVISALVDDTVRQVPLLESAIQERDAQKCMRLAHYSKGACANVGASRAAGLFKHIETKAAGGEFVACTESLAALARELDLLRSASVSFQQ